MFGTDLSFSSANLSDILPPCISDIHAQLMVNYLEKLDTVYINTSRKGLISLNENIYQDIHYKVKLYPIITMEPMLMLFLRKIKDHSKDKDKFMLVLDKNM